MKKTVRICLTLVFLIYLFQATSAQVHGEMVDLRGFEDADGRFHLLISIRESCSNTSSESTVAFTYLCYITSIYHYDVEAAVEKLIFRTCPNTSSRINCQGVSTDYAVFANFATFDYPDEWVLQKIDSRVTHLADHRGNSFDIGIFATFFLLSPAKDTLFLNQLNKTLPIPADSDSWPEFDEEFGVNDYLDEYQFDGRLMAIHPVLDSVYFAHKSNNLYRSMKYSGNFERVDTVSNIRSMLFDADLDHVFALHSFTNQGNRVFVLRRSDRLGEPDSWTDLAIPEPAGEFRNMVNDPLQSGSLYLADDSTIYLSNDFGETFELVTALDDRRITGMHKMKGEDILYVLTNNELFKIDNGEFISLKMLADFTSVSEPGQPERFHLSQNYPNPFNPVTTIRYELPEASPVKLKVYDLTGRHIATLVDGTQQAGTHESSWEASAFASGMYIYRLQAGDFSESRLMMLIK